MTFNRSILAFFLLSFSSDFILKCCLRFITNTATLPDYGFIKTNPKVKKNNNVIHIKEINEKPQWNKAGVNVTFRSFCKAL